MRDILAALLRARGYTHDDERDPNDMHWYGPTLGVRPLLVCVSHEMNRDFWTGAPKDAGTRGYHTYDVSVADRPLYVHGEPVAS